eukprot:scaffold42691_cov78-Cyclotella_meneghiniana.AAC.13
MQVEEGRKGPALCAPSLSKTSHPQAYRTFSAYFLACHLRNFEHLNLFKATVAKFASVGHKAGEESICVSPVVVAIAITLGHPGICIQRLISKAKDRNL